MEEGPRKPLYRREPVYRPEKRKARILAVTSAVTSLANFGLAAVAESHGRPGIMAVTALAAIVGLLNGGYLWYVKEADVPDRHIARRIPPRKKR